MQACSARQHACMYSCSAGKHVLFPCRTRTHVLLLTQIHEWCSRKLAVHVFVQQECMQSSPAEIWIHVLLVDENTYSFVKREAFILLQRDTGILLGEECMYYRWARIHAFLLDVNTCMYSSSARIRSFLCDRHACSAHQEHMCRNSTKNSYMLGQEEYMYYCWELVQYYWRWLNSEVLGTDQIYEIYTQ